MFDLTGKNAVITGSSKGIGREIFLSLRKLKIKIKILLL